MDKQIKKFLSFAIIDLLKSNVSIDLKNSNIIIYQECGLNTRVSGYFDERHNILSCATGKPQHEWVPIFVHEYCHFKQWSEQIKEYKELLKYKAEKKVEEWLSKKQELSKEKLNLCIHLIQQIELNCEKRVVKLIDKYKLPFDKTEYIKAANAYILYYNIIKKNRDWYTVAPYSVKEILDIVPDHFLNSYSRTPKKFRELVYKHCFK